MKHFITAFLLLLNLSLKAQSSQSPNFNYGILLSGSIISQSHYAKYSSFTYSPSRDKNLPILGFGASFFYKVKKDKFSIGWEVPSILPHIPPKGGYDYALPQIFELLDFHQISKGLNLIGGINYIGYSYHAYFDEPNMPDINKHDGTMGLTLGAGLSTTSSGIVSFNLIYRPSLISFNTKFYRDVISLVLKININFKKEKH